MNVNEHPELELLKDYLGNSAADKFSDIRLHLAQCAQCRSHVDALTDLNNISHQSTDSLDELQHQKISDYVNNILSPEDKKTQKTFIESDPRAMRAALHYASQKSFLDRSAQPGSSSIKSTTSTLNFWDRQTQKLKLFLSYKTPAWLSVPVTAALIALLSFNLFKPDLAQQPYTVASYQDNAIIQFRSKDNLPGIGFFAQSESSSENYNGITIAVTTDRQFKFIWPAIANATKYHLRLQVFDQGKKYVIGNISTSQPSAIISPKLTDLFHRYEWVLTGDTSDNQTFMANGGFVITPPTKGK